MIIIVSSSQRFLHVPSSDYDRRGSSSTSSSKNRGVDQSVAAGALPPTVSFGRGPVSVAASTVAVSPPEPHPHHHHPPPPPPVSPYGPPLHLGYHQVTAGNALAGPHAPVGGEHRLHVQQQQQQQQQQIGTTGHLSTATTTHSTASSSSSSSALSSVLVHHQPTDQFGHCPKAREGPALGCNYCWNTTDTNGRILRRKTKYHCPECQANLCIVPCFQQYHEALEREKGEGNGDQPAGGPSHPR